MPDEVDFSAVADRFYVFPAGGAVRRRWHLNRLRLFELMGISRDHVVLDAGCGAGNLVFMIAPHCRVAVGCDAYHDRLAFGAKRGRGAYVQASIEELPLAEESIDKILCLEVLEHLKASNSRRVLLEFHRVLRPDGQLLITTPNYRSPWPAIEFAMEALGLVPKVPGNDHLSKYNRQTLTCALAAAGFHVLRGGSFNHLSPFAAALSERWAERLYHWELRANPPGGNLLYCLLKKA